MTVVHESKDFLDFLQELADTECSELNLEFLEDLEAATDADRPCSSTDILDNATEEDH